MKTTIKIKKSEFQKLYNIACNTWKPKFEEKFKNFLFSDTIEFEKDFLEDMRKACTEDQLKVFNVIFKAYLKEENDLFNIKDYSELCKKYKIKELKISDFKFLPKEEQEKSLAYHQIKTIERIYNGIDWVLDWSNTNQYKYYPYFVYKVGSSLVFYGSDCDSICCSGQVAYFKDEKTSTFVGKTFIDIYRKLS